MTFRKKWRDEKQLPDEKEIFPLLSKSCFLTLKVLARVNLLAFCVEENNPQKWTQIHFSSLRFVVLLIINADSLSMWQEVKLGEGQTEFSRI